MSDAGEISDKDKFEKVKHKVPEKYHEALKNCADNWDQCMIPLKGAKEFCDYIKYVNSLKFQEEPNYLLRGRYSDIGLLCR